MEYSGSNFVTSTFLCVCKYVSVFMDRCSPSNVHVHVASFEVCFPPPFLAVEIPVVLCTQFFSLNQLVAWHSPVHFKQKYKQIKPSLRDKVHF